MKPNGRRRSRRPIAKERHGERDRNGGVGTPRRLASYLERCAHVYLSVKGPPFTALILAEQTQRSRNALADRGNQRSSTPRQPIHQRRTCVLIQAGLNVSMDERGCWMDDVFIGAFGSRSNIRAFGRRRRCREPMDIWTTLACR